MKNRCKRQKAIFGIISGIIGASKQKKQAKAQAQAAKIQAANQQAAINQQMANAQAQIDANYQQQLAEVEAQEKLNQEQNELSAQKVGIQSAQSLTQAFGNTADIDKEFKNRFMRCGGRKKYESGGGTIPWLGIASAVDSGIGNIISAATAQTGVPAYKLDYSGRLKYHDPVVANLEVDKSIANSYTGKQVGQNNAQYAGTSSIGNNNINNMPTMRFRAGGKSVFRNRSKRKC